MPLESHNERVSEQSSPSHQRLITGIVPRPRGRPPLAAKFAGRDSGVRIQTARKSCNPLQTAARGSSSPYIQKLSHSQPRTLSGVISGRIQKDSGNLLQVFQQQRAVNGPYPNLYQIHRANLSQQQGQVPLDRPRQQIRVLPSGFPFSIHPS